MNEKDSENLSEINKMTVSKKKELMEFYNSNDYNREFNRGGLLGELIKDIRFSDDEKFAFICKIHLGKCK